jgi:signal-transduction protein with cAMP-binding, CBS, and nucleotidyltransferase domain
LTGGGVEVEGRMVSLTNLEKRTIKDAFHLVSRVQDQVLERYKAAIL